MLNIFGGHGTFWPPPATPMRCTAFLYHHLIYGKFRMWKVRYKFQPPILHNDAGTFSRLKLTNRSV